MTTPLFRLVDFQRTVQHRPSIGSRATRLSKSLCPWTFDSRHYGLLASQEAVAIEDRDDHYDELVRLCRPTPMPKPQPEGRGWESPPEQEIRRPKEGRRRSYASAVGKRVTWASHAIQTDEFGDKAKPPLQGKEWFEVLRQPNQLMRLEPHTDATREMIRSFGPPRGPEMRPNILSLLPTAIDSRAAILGRMFNTRQGDGLVDIIAAMETRLSSDQLRRLLAKPLESQEDWVKGVEKKREKAEERKLRNELAKLLSSDAGTSQVVDLRGQFSGDLAEEGQDDIPEEAPELPLPHTNSRASFHSLLEHLNFSESSQVPLHVLPEDSGAAPSPSSLAAVVLEAARRSRAQPWIPVPKVEPPAAETSEPVVTVLRPSSGGAARWERLSFRGDHALVERPGGMTVSLGVQANHPLEAGHPDPPDSPREWEAPQPRSEPIAIPTHAAKPPDILTLEIDKKRAALSPFARRMSNSWFVRQHLPESPRAVVRQNPPALNRNIEPPPSDFEAAEQFRNVDHPGPTLEFKGERKRLEEHRRRQTQQSIQRRPDAEDEPLNLELPLIERQPSPSLPHRKRRSRLKPNHWDSRVDRLQRRLPPQGLILERRMVRAPQRSVRGGRNCVVLYEKAPVCWSLLKVTSDDELSCALPAT